ncbi:hypothetical protein [Paractinoplanes hotanensis]|uniref:Uncharacterized protein n=1 Tax=Paractinoplanes hotanensis TaxID=2906497 RepID=A0ABT0XR23_9ACTN|nr:hypothetical protein [Actinoplanes hotanensis]MCM4076222.1 hypothetical protein [Actinoplanes hotanensis]
MTARQTRSNDRRGGRCERTHRIDDYGRSLPPDLLGSIFQRRRNDRAPGSTGGAVRNPVAYMPVRKPTARIGVRDAVAHNGVRDAVADSIHRMVAPSRRNAVVGGPGEATRVPAHKHRGDAPSFQLGSDCAAAAAGAAQNPDLVCHDPLPLMTSRVITIAAMTRDVITRMAE